ncbi:MAG: UDP-N-acetylmuramate dehydrogenase [candidate division WOR-3 bacterium]
MIVLTNKKFIKRNINLKNKNTLRISSTASFYAEPRNIDEIFDALEFAEKRGLKTLFIGGGSNILLPDGVFDVLVISTSSLKEFIYTDDGVIADAGVKFSELIKSLSEKGLGGLEFIAGIPATVGGAIYMNLGSMGKEISQYLKEVFVYENGFLKKLKREEIEFSYRKGYTKGIIISAYFKLEKKDKKVIKEEIISILNKKRETQPLEYPSAGCVFKNPSKEQPAGKLIELAGLKGLRIGGAEVSRKHANFIINVNNAKSSDIKEIIKIVQEKVYEKFGIKLKRELIYAEEILNER